MANKIESQPKVIKTEIVNLPLYTQLPSSSGVSKRRSTELLRRQKSDPAVNVLIKNNVTTKDQLFDFNLDLSNINSNLPVM